MSSGIPYPLFDYNLLYNWMLPVGVLLATAGTVMQLRKAAGAQDKLMILVSAAALVALMASFDWAVQETKTLVHTIVHKGLHATPEETAQKFAIKMLELDQSPGGSSFWDKVTKTAEVMFHAFLVSLILFASLVAFSLNFLAYLAQEMALEFGIGFAPLMTGFLFLTSTRSIGVQFLLYMLAIALIPLGWGAASLVSDRLIDMATSGQLGSAPDGSTGGASMTVAFRTLLSSLILAIWIVLSTLVAPFAIIRMVTTGVHISTDPIKQLIRIALRF